MERPNSKNESQHQVPDDFNCPGNLTSNQVTDKKAKGELVLSPDPRDLPFEFIALEACLEAACRSLENEVKIESFFMKFY